MANVTLAFDVYGTLIDTNGVVSLLQEMLSDPILTKNFSNTWRAKQLEYSFRRGLMQNYVSFSQCTAQALDYSCLAHNIVLSQSDKQQLLACYQTLPCFADVPAGLAQLKELNYRLFAFSNGDSDTVKKLLAHAGIAHFFSDVVSVDELKTFKPNPGVYSYFLRETQSLACKTWLISSNPFDVTGAISHGIRSVWIKRSEAAIFDPWEIQPTEIANDLTQLKSKLLGEK